MYNNTCTGYKRMRECGNASSVLRKGAWTAEEDMLLKNCIQKYGEGKWHLVPLKAGLNRCRKSCRLRWLNYLRPNIKRGDFGKDEVDLMLRLHKLLGNRWSLIAGRIPGRTANDVKNYWNTHLRSRFKQQKEESRDGFTVIKPQARIFSKTLNQNPIITAHDDDLIRSTDKAINTSPLISYDKFNDYVDELFDDHLNDEVGWSFDGSSIEGETSDVVEQIDQNNLFDFSIDDVIMWDLLDA